MLQFPLHRGQGEVSLAGLGVESWWWWWPRARGRARAGAGAGPAELVTEPACSSRGGSVMVRVGLSPVSPL